MKRLLTRSEGVGARTLLIALACVLGFAWLHVASQGLEAQVAARAVRVAGGAGHIAVVRQTSILVTPFHGSAFRAVITPSCSALASILALACLSSLSTGYPRRRRLRATVAAVATVAAGNIVRIAFSVAVGLLFGRSSLVLFHDWVGGALTFVYTLGGYILMLYLLLPDRRRETTSQAVAVA